MMSSAVAPVETRSNCYDGIVSDQREGMIIIRSADRKVYRRVLYLNSYGMAQTWRALPEYTPGHHLWGCLELARRGYEIALPEEPNRNSRFYNYRRQDFRHLGFAKSWLGKEGIVYSAHTVLFWTPLLASLGLLRSPVVTLLYARGEGLRFAGGYSGVIGMTPAAEERARSLAPKAKIAHLGWGVDLSCYPMLPYEPKWFLCCGKTRRDFNVLAGAASLYPEPIRVINTDLPSGITWPQNVQRLTGGRGGEWSTVSYQELVYEHYSGCHSSLILLQEDSKERYGAGFTQMLEAMALGRPIIVTRTGAAAGEIDVEKEGCGLFVPPNDPAALARAMKQIAENPEQAEAMGRAGRRLCETHYNIERYARDLHDFFESM